MIDRPTGRASRRPAAIVVACAVGLGVQAGHETVRGESARPPSTSLRIATPGSPLPGEICDEGGLCWERPRPQGENLASVWAGSSRDVWSVGARGTILHFDGTRWERVPSPSAENLVSVWGRSPESIWILSDRGGLLRWDGRRILTSVRSVAQTDRPPEKVNERAVDAQPSPTVDDPLMAGVQPPDLEPGDQLTVEFGGLSGAGESLWLVGGARHTPQHAGDERRERLALIWGFDGHKWTRTAVKDFPPARGVWGESGRDVWVLATDPDDGNRFRALHFDGRTWRREEHIPIEVLAGGASHWPAAVSFGGWSSSGPIWKPKAPLVWEIGKGGAVLRRDLLSGPAAGFAGGRTYRGFDPRITDLFGIEAGELWVVGASGALYHFDGSTWSGSGPGAEDKLYDLRAISAVGPELWAVGAHGVIAREPAGTKWSEVPIPNAGAFYAAWGASPDDAWVVGDMGRILHCVRQKCVQARSPSPGARVISLKTIAGLGPNDIWAAGSPAGTASHWDGKTWNDVAIPTRQPVAKIYAGRGELWMGNARWDGKTWTLNGTLPAAVVPAGVRRIIPGGPGEYWLQSPTELVHWQGRAVSRAAVSRPYDVVCAGATGEIWLFGPRGYLHGEHGHWRSAPAMSPLDEDIVADCTTVGNATWVVGRGGRVLRATPSPR